jgi:hypothetical protein
MTASHLATVVSFKMAGVNENRIFFLTALSFEAASSEEFVVPVSKSTMSRLLFPHDPLTRKNTKLEGGFDTEFHSKAPSTPHCKFQLLCILVDLLEREDRFQLASSGRLSASLMVSRACRSLGSTTAGLNVGMTSFDSHSMKKVKNRVSRAILALHLATRRINS